MATMGRRMAMTLGVGGLMMMVMTVVVTVMALRVTNHPPVCPGLSWF